MGFIRFIGNSIAFITVIYVFYNGYKIYKSKNYRSKKTLITFIVAIIGVAIADPLMGMQSKSEIEVAKKQSERVESKKDHSESVKEAVALSKRIEADNSKVKEAQKAKQESLDFEKTSEGQLAKKVGNNRIFGQFKKVNKHFKDETSGYTIETRNSLKVGYAYNTGNSIISNVKLDFRSLPLNPDLDKELISEHLHDYIPADAALKTTNSDTEYIYHSDSIQKDFKVTYQLSSSNEISLIMILGL